MVALLLVSAIGCASPRNHQQPEVIVDAVNLIVQVRDVVVNLETDCGIGQSLVRREVDAISEYLGDGEWEVLVFLNQIPALRIGTDSGAWQCEIASKAFKSRPRETRRRPRSDDLPTHGGDGADE